MNALNTPPLAIIPCRLGSVGILHKNIRPLAGVSPVLRAARIAREAGCTICLTSDADRRTQISWGCEADHYLVRPAALATSSTPMVEVIRHALELTRQSERIVLLQPTQPLRRASYVRRALEWLWLDTTLDSVVSVTAIPPTHAPAMQVVIDDAHRMHRWEAQGQVSETWAFPATRQALAPTYIRDGTVYAFWRDNLRTAHTLYGHQVRALVIPPEHTCALDTPADWIAAERRLSAPVVS